MDIDLNKDSKIESITVGELVIPMEKPISIEELETVTKIDFQNITSVEEELTARRKEVSEWENKEEIYDFGSRLNHKKQVIFVGMLVNKKKVRKKKIIEEFEKRGLNTESYSMPGVQSSVTRNVRKTGKEKFWKSYTENGIRVYELLEKYQ